MQTQEDLQKINILKESFKQKVKEIQSTLQEEFKSITNEIFATFESVNAIRWNQYTPYFNDGDECVFGLEYIRVRFDDTEEEAGELEDGFNGEYCFYDIKELVGEEFDKASTKKKIVKEIISFIESVPEDTMLGLFGNHVTVTIKRNEIEIEEYEHD